MEEARQHPALSRWGFIAGVAHLVTVGLVLLGLLAIPFFGPGLLLPAVALYLLSVASGRVVWVVRAPAMGEVRFYGTIRRADRPLLFWGIVGLETIMIPIVLAAAVVLFRIAFDRLHIYP